MDRAVIQAAVEMAMRGSSDGLKEYALEEWQQEAVTSIVECCKQCGLVGDNKIKIHVVDDWDE